MENWLRVRGRRNISDVFPSELLAVKVKKGRAEPAYLKADVKGVGLAAKVADIYLESIGRRRSEIRKSLAVLEEDTLFNFGVDYRVLRGLGLVVERYCSFQPKYTVEPRAARVSVFTEASKSPVASIEERSAVLNAVASRLGVTVPELEESMYADLEQNQVLEKCDPPEPGRLIAEYNLSLTQTLLLRCLRLEVSMSSGWKRVLRNVRRLGLMYSAQPLSADPYDERLKLVVDGPVSLFKQTERYGSALASLVPDVVFSQGQWSLKADLTSKTRRAVFGFELDSSRFQELFSAMEHSHPSKDYDSSVEENFAKRFQTLGTGWKLTREPVMLRAGSSVAIPDFGFEKEGVRAYMEIVGFWTPQYLRTKIAKLHAAATGKRLNLILAVDESLACSRIERLSTAHGFELIYFKREVPLAAVLGFLNQLKKASPVQPDQTFSDSVQFSERLVDLSNEARKLGVSLSELESRFLASPPSGYLYTPGYLVSKELAEDLAALTEGAEKLQGKIMQNIVAKLGSSEFEPALRALGYRVKWIDLSPEHCTAEKVAHTAVSDV
ncbi:MAG: DUF790 family protein [Thermoprotei archaeon]